MREQESFLVIAKHALDEDWIKQPKLYHEVALKLADARLDHDEAKDKLELTMAEIDRVIRIDPEKYGVTKITETSVERAIILTKTYQSAKKRVNETKHTVDVLAAVSIALEHKKKALENLVQLEARDYFSEPKAPQGSVEEMSQRERRAVFNRKKM